VPLVLKELADFLVVHPSGQLLLIEVKLTADDDQSPDRDGLRDMLAYLSDASEVLQGMADPHGLVVAWNSQAAPTHSAEVTIANQHNFQSTIQDLVFGIERGPGRSR
jgi:hypothetical protein